MRDVGLPTETVDSTKTQTIYIIKLKSWSYLEHEIPNILQFYTKFIDEDFLKSLVFTLCCAIL